jgi:hypothetical protein
MDVQQEPAEDGPWTPQQLLALSGREQQEAEEALGHAWREEFADDLDELYDYVDR